MPCPQCERPMRALFTSCVCDYCDGLVDVPWSIGFVVHEGQEQSGRLVYIFRTRTDAARYRASRGLRHCHIREVRTDAMLEWKVLTTAGLEGVEIADRPFEIYPDHRFPPRANRAFLVPLERPRAAA